jgi:hypothetical protein
MKNKKETKKTDVWSVIAYVAVAIIVISLINIGTTKFTGYVTSNTSTATVNVTVSAQTWINFTTNNINFGTGTVTGSNNATLESNGSAATRGSWTWTAANFVLENIGNTNVTLDLKTGQNATSLLGGTPANAAYQYAVSNNEPGSCANSDITLNQWYDVNTTDPGTRLCGNFTFINTNDTINITVRLVIPTDSIQGALSDTFTAKATG